MEYRPVVTMSTKLERIMLSVLFKTVLPILWHRVAFVSENIAFFSLLDILRLTEKTSTYLRLTYVLMVIFINNVVIIPNRRTKVKLLVNASTII